MFADPDIPASGTDDPLDTFPAFLLHPLIAPYIPTAFLSLTNRHLLAFSLSIIASMGTFLGGILVLLLVRILGTANSPTLIGTLQAFSAGVMIYMTFIDLIPEAIEQIGNRETMGFFFLGVALFGVLETVVLPGDHDDHHGHSHGPVKRVDEKEVNSGDSKRSSVVDRDSEEEE
ncbi:hypothetical protein HDU67_001787, partial [Dinochytrium kinnereticum]